MVNVCGFMVLTVCWVVQLLAGTVPIELIAGKDPRNPLSANEFRYGFGESSSLACGKLEGIQDALCAEVAKRAIVVEIQIAPSPSGG